MKNLIVFALVAGLSLATTALAAKARSGEAIYQKHCAMCHATGVAGAPKFGSAADWKPHMAEGGFDHLVEIATKGEGAMPPMGGCNDCTKEEFKATIHYMVDQSLGKSK